MAPAARLHRPAPFAVLAALALAAAPCRAEGPAGASEPPTYRVVLASGYDLGLTRGSWVVLSDGRRQYLASNGGLTVAAGVAVPMGASGLEVRGTIGWKRQVAGTRRDGLSYQAYPLEVLAAWPVRTWLRLGAGLSLALAPRISGAGQSAYLSGDLSPAVGLVGQAELLSTELPGGRRSALGLRFLWQTLRRENAAAAQGASAIGLVAGVSL